MKVKRNIKCILCDFKSKDKRKIYDHIEKCHNDQIPSDISIPQYFYNASKGVTHGNCVMCKNPTEWNESTNKYKRFCNDPKCKAKYNDIFNKRMLGKYGKVHLLNDPKVQQKMLENRKISGKYEWSDGSGSKAYTGTYEHKFLEYCDLVLELPYDDVMTPCPFIFCYTINGDIPKKPKYFTEDEYDCLPENVKLDIANTYLLYRPDAYIPSINMIVEIKHGGANPNMHHKIQNVDVVKDKAKEEVLKSQSQFNFMKITDNNYGDFLTYFMNIKHFEDESINKGKPNILIGENMGVLSESNVGTLHVYIIRDVGDMYTLMVTTEEDTQMGYVYTGLYLNMSDITYDVSKYIRRSFQLIKPFDMTKYVGNKNARAFDMFVREHITVDPVLLTQSPYEFYIGDEEPVDAPTTTISEVLSLLDALGGRL